MSAYEHILDRLGDAVVHRNGNQSEARCPSHDDRRASLSIGVGTKSDPCAVLCCQAGCGVEAVLAAIGLELGALYDSWWEPSRNGSNWDPIAVYDYADEHDGLLFQCVRFHPKDFRQRRPDGRGGWIWSLKETRRVLYRLPQVIEAVAAGRRIWVVEGEKDVHAIERKGHVATCNPMGAGKGKWRQEYAETLRGANVVVVADRDNEGREHARRIAQSLEGVAASVSVVEAAVGKDASDHLAAGKTVDEFVALQEDADEEQRRPEVLRELDVERMLSTPPPPVPWIVEPILARGCVTMLAGREGRGKSMLALALASAIGRATGLIDVAGMRVGLSGHVLYVDAENGEHEAHRRIHGLSVQSGMFRYFEANGFDLKRQMVLLEELVKKHKPDVLILDSLRSLAPGLDENDSMQAEAALRPLVRLAQQLNIAILILHHASRASGEYRGSTAIGAAVELGFTLSRIEDDPMAATRRKLQCWKSRPAAEPAPQWLTIKPDEGGGIMLREAAAYEPERSHPVQDAIEEVLRGLIEEACGGCGDPSGDHNTTTPQPPSWTGADFARAVGREPADWSVRQVVARLEGAGLIHLGDDGRWQPGPRPDADDAQEGQDG